MAGFYPLRGEGKKSQKPARQIRGKRVPPEFATCFVECFVYNTFPHSLVFVTHETRAPAFATSSPTPWFCLRFCYSTFPHSPQSATNPSSTFTHSFTATASPRSTATGSQELLVRAVHHQLVLHRFAGAVVTTRSPTPRSPPPTRLPQAHRSCWSAQSTTNSSSTGSQELLVRAVHHQLVLHRLAGAVVTARSPPPPQVHSHGRRPSRPPRPTIPWFLWSSWSWRTGWPRSILRITPALSRTAPPPLKNFQQLNCSPAHPTGRRLWAAPAGPFAAGRRAAPAPPVCLGGAGGPSGHRGRRPPPSGGGLAGGPGQRGLARQYGAPAAGRVGGCPEYYEPPWGSYYGVLNIPCFTYRVLCMAERSKFVTDPVIRSSSSIDSCLLRQGTPLRSCLDDFAKPLPPCILFLHRRSGFYSRACRDVYLLYTCTRVLSHITQF